MKISPACRDYLDGIPLEVIFKKHGVRSTSLFYEHLLVNGIEPNRLTSASGRAREAKILRSQGLTFAEIGNRLTPPVSRQRAHQLVNIV